MNIWKNKQKEQKKTQNISKIVGSGMTGVIEIVIFHPIDTISKRMMSNYGRITNFEMLRNVIFRDGTKRGVENKMLNLFSGLGYAAFYKIFQRIYKYGGQPLVNEYLSNNCSKDYERLFSTETAKSLLSATSGSIIGLGEIVLLPLDVLKIKRQTNPESFKGRNFIQIVLNEGFLMYRGWSWTAARNIPGSFALFGGNSFARQYLFSNKKKTTWFENIITSIFGASASLIVSAPFDVVKTRIQNRNFENPESGFKIFTSMIKNEGLSSFFKGLTPKLLTVGPKLVFSFSLAQTLIPILENCFN